MRAIELEIPPRRDFLPLVRLVIGASLDLDPAHAAGRHDDMRLAVTEACANAIEATQSREAVDPIRLRIAFDAERFVVEVADHGGGFDPGELTALPPATDPKRLSHERGLGISIMRAAVDDVRFEALPDGTAVQLTIYRPSR